MKHKKIIITLVAVGLVVLMVLIPVNTSEAACGKGARFSILLAQIENFRAATVTATEPSSCPANLYDNVPNRLYIL